MMNIPSIKEKDYKLRIIGKSGVFKTRHKESVEFVQTSIPISQLRVIEPVRRKFKKGELDFELMLQRDLDDSRIIDELIPYLQRDKHLSFFPPILVVILEIAKDAGSGQHIIKGKYPEKTDNPDLDDHGFLYFVRRYGNLFSIKILKDANDGSLNRWLTELSVSYNATLLAIDGQHRLVALQAVTGLLEEKEAELYGPQASAFKDDLKDLEVPVTFIFIPESYEGNDSDSLLSIFRQIFVDVNKNARTVSDMRNILLEEHDIRSIYTRMTCSFLRKPGTPIDNLISIDEVEWDKESKEFQMSNPMAITNLSIMKQIFDQWMPDDQSLKTFMKLDRYKKKLNEAEYPYAQLAVDNYSYTQKEILRDIFDKEYIKGFSDLFSSIPFSLERSKLVKKIKSDLDKCSEDTDSLDHILCGRIRQYLFDGSEHKALKGAKGFKQKYAEIVKIVDDFDQKKFMSFVRTAMFQLALFKLIRDLIGASDREFIDFCGHFKDVVSSDAFASMWKKNIVDNKDALEKAIKGNGTYSKSKSDVVYEFMKIVVANNKEVFRELKINWKQVYTDSEKVCNQFWATFESTIEDEKTDVKKDKRNDFGKFLRKYDLTCKGPIHQ